MKVSEASTQTIMGIESTTTEFNEERMVNWVGLFFRFRVNSASAMLIVTQVKSAGRNLPTYLT